MRKLFLIPAAAMLSATFSQAQTITWDGSSGDGKWGTAENWAGDNVPDSNTEIAQNGLNDAVFIEVDGDYTINSFVDGFSGEGFITTLGGAGTLTIDRNSASVAVGVDNATGGAGGTLRFNGNLTINNTLGAATNIRNTNSSSNTVLFDTGSVLTLQTILRTNETAAAAGSSFRFNGTFGASTADIQIGSTNVSIGTGHDSTGFGRDIVLLANSKLAVNDGLVLGVGRKFQVNGAAELELNGANAVQGANIVVGGANALLLDVNSDQEHLGAIVVTNGSLTIDVDAAVTNVSFASSYTRVWGTGTVTINGFREGTIRFGTNAAGLTREQLAVINGGIYSLTSEGYLTAASIRHWALFEIDEQGYVSLSPWIERYAFVNAAPFILVDEAGWLYMDEVVGVRGFGWAYAYDLAAMAIELSDDSGYGYSFTLNRWVYSPAELAGDAAGWVYVL